MKYGMHIQSRKSLGLTKLGLITLSISMNLWASLLGCCVEREVPGGLPHTDWVYNLVQGYSADLPATGSWLWPDEYCLSLPPFLLAQQSLAWTKGIATSVSWAGNRGRWYSLVTTKGDRLKPPVLSKKPSTLGRQTIDYGQTHCLEGFHVIWKHALFMA